MSAVPTSPSSTSDTYHAVPRRRWAADPSPRWQPDWKHVARMLLTSRALDDLEENTLLPARKLFYQFSARGHDLSQLVLSQLLDHPHDAINGYYRSRPLMLGIGLSPQQALAAPMMRAGGFSDGRDIGVVFNHPGVDAPSMLPMCGGVGAQYTPVAGWAQSVRYRHDLLGESQYRGAIGVAHGGEASCSTNGFWSALTMATTLKLPMLFYIEDNGYGISVSSDMQTPGCNIAANLSGFKNLYLADGDGTDAMALSAVLGRAVAHVRSWQGPALVRLTVPRLCGHSAQDTQTYKDAQVLAAEQARDPLPRFKTMLVPALMSDAQWEALEQEVQAEVAEAAQQAQAQPMPDPATVTRHAFFEGGQHNVQQMGGRAAELGLSTVSDTAPVIEGGRINMLTAIRQTLDSELARDSRVVVFGEDVGRKGGVHAATMGLQQKHGEGRVFDTSLSEEGIIGRAVGMALAGLMPVPEIQFRKYADPAEEQLNDCGTMRWRTNNRFAAPMVVRMPGGFFKCGDPWHSQSGEVKWAHAVGWKLAMPSNASDAAGLLRTAIRGNDPVVFFEHRSLLDDASARRPYPGDEYMLPFGQANVVREGAALTVVSWGAMVSRCLQAATQLEQDIEVIDLRTLVPWDKAAVLASIRKTNRCLIVHEDNISAGFGAEIAACLTEEVFFDLDAPVRRLAMPDIPSPHSPLLLDAAVPSVTDIGGAMTALIAI